MYITQYQSKQTVLAAESICKSKTLCILIVGRNAVIGSSVSPVRNILEEVHRNARDESGTRSKNVDVPEEEHDHEFMDLTELEKQIVAKYLSELDPSEEYREESIVTECDLNNNATVQEKENCTRKFPTDSNNDDLTTSMDMFLRKWPQLNRSTSLETTGDSVEDLVSACPPYVHYLKPFVAAAAQSSTPGQFQELVFAAATDSTVASPCNHAPTISTPPRPSNPTTTSNGATTSVSTSYICCSAANRDNSQIKAEPKMGGSKDDDENSVVGNRKRRYTDLARALSVGGDKSTDNARLNNVDNDDKEKKNKNVKRRPNYSVWMGVTSCIWGLLFYLMKSYM